MTVRSMAWGNLRSRLPLVFFSSSGSSIQPSQIDEILRRPDLGSRIDLFSQWFLKLMRVKFTNCL